jgi:hypothetical protein
MNTIGNLQEQRKIGPTGKKENGMNDFIVLDPIPTQKALIRTEESFFPEAWSKNSFNIFCSMSIPYFFVVCHFILPMLIHTLDNLY